MPLVYLLVAFSWCFAVMADTPESILLNYAVEAKLENPAFVSFDARRGDVFFHVTHGGEWSCA